METGVTIDGSKDAEARRISVMIAVIDEAKNGEDAATLIIVITDPRAS
jgi:C4-type Zn-finger protein